MTRARLHLFDTTLRDGQQTPGIDFSVEDKIAIASMLDEFGIDYVEGGYPGANPTDTAFFAQRRTSSAKFVAFGMTKRVGVSASNDPGLAALLQAKSDAICFVAKSWDYHVRARARLHQRGEPRRHPRLGRGARSRPARRRWSTASISSTATRPTRTMRSPAPSTAFDAGARWVVLCDTNGGTQPSEIRAIVEAVIASGIPGEQSRHPRP